MINLNNYLKDIFDLLNKNEFNNFENIIKIIKKDLVKKLEA